MKVNFQLNSNELCMFAINFNICIFECEYDVVWWEKDINEKNSEQFTAKKKMEIRAFYNLMKYVRRTNSSSWIWNDWMKYTGAITTTCNTLSLPLPVSLLLLLLRHAQIFPGIRYSESPGEQHIRCSHDSIETTLSENV